VVRGAHSTLDVQGIPPKTSPRWSIDQVDVSFGTWSPDDSKLAVHAGGRLREGRSLDDRAGRLDHPGHPAQRLTGQRD
jgi:hypothetical protein